MERNLAVDAAITLNTEFCKEATGTLKLNTAAIQMHYLTVHQNEWPLSVALNNFAKLRYLQEVISNEGARVHGMLMSSYSGAALLTELGANKKLETEYGTVSYSGQSGEKMAVLDQKKLIAAIGQDTFNAVATVSQDNLRKAIGTVKFNELVKDGIIKAGVTVQTIKYGKPSELSAMKEEDK